MELRLTPDGPVSQVSDRGLWRDHPTTREQQRRHGKATQADLLLAKLRQARADHSALTLPEVMKLGIAQHSARFNELRRRGFVIKNRMQRVDGIIRSSYELIHDPEWVDPQVQP